MATSNDCNTGGNVVLHTTSSDTDGFTEILKKLIAKPPMNQKYKLTSNTLEFMGRTLYQIKALGDFGMISKGELGGWVESEDNLSFFNTCWIDESSKVMDKATVSDHARVVDGSILCDNARATGNSTVLGSYLKDRSKVNTSTCEFSIMEGVCGIYKGTNISHCRLQNAVILEGGCTFNGIDFDGDFNFTQSGLELESGEGNNITVRSLADFVVLHNLGSIERTVYYIVSENIVRAGCFRGSINQFEKAVKHDYPADSNYYPAVAYFKTLREQYKARKKEAKKALKAEKKAKKKAKKTK